VHAVVKIQLTPVLILPNRDPLSESHRHSYHCRPDMSILQLSALMLRVDVLMDTVGVTDMIYFDCGD
jgi:hypothetical protein